MLAAHTALVGVLFVAIIASISVGSLASTTREATTRKA